MDLYKILVCMHVVFLKHFNVISSIIGYKIVSVSES